MAERGRYKNIVLNPSTASDVLAQLSLHPHFLDYPRTLEIDVGSVHLNPDIQLVPSIMQMIPRMANLKSLRIIRIPYFFSSEEFIPMLMTCLQQSPSIEQLYLSHVHEFPLSVLSDSKGKFNKLTLSDCTAAKEVELAPVSSLGPGSSRRRSLETLILSGDHNRDLHIWATHGITGLKSLGLRDLSLDLDWTAFPGLLAACSKSLTTLHLDIEPNCSNTYLFDADRLDGYWINEGPELPFTLSQLTHLTNLSIFSRINATATSIDSALPKIIRLVNTAGPAIQRVVLRFQCRVPDGARTIAYLLGLLDWSILDRLQSGNVTGGGGPRIELCFISNGEGGRVRHSTFSPESILGALAGNKVLMGLVNRGLVDFKSERTLALWEETS